jgi:hypothetical protein
MGELVTPKKTQLELAKTSEPMTSSMPWKSFDDGELYRLKNDRATFRARNHSSEKNVHEGLMYKYYLKREFSLVARGHSLIKDFRSI